MSESPQEDRVLEVLWQRAVLAWDDDEAHAALIEHALAAHALPTIASRYRALGDDPAKGPRAKRQLDRIVLAATQMLIATRTPRPVRPPLAITLSAVGVCVLLLSWLAFAMWGRH